MIFSEKFTLVLKKLLLKFISIIQNFYFMKASILSLVIVGAILIGLGIYSIFFSSPIMFGAAYEKSFWLGIALLASGGGSITIAILYDKK